MASDLARPGTRALLFDLMGVLLFRRPDYLPNPLVEQIDDRIGRVTDDRRFKDEILHRYHLNESEFDEILARIVDKYASFSPLWALLPELRKRYKLGIINNGTYLTFPLLNARFELERTFDLLLCSAREGMVKPEARLYRRACRRLGLAPAECLFMDDSEENIIGARQAGMQAIHWPDQASGFQAFQDWLTGEDI